VAYSYNAPHAKDCRSALYTITICLPGTILAPSSRSLVYAKTRFELRGANATITDAIAWGGVRRGNFSLA
jgi:hypothetical protein